MFVDWSIAWSVSSVSNARSVLWLLELGSRLWGHSTITCSAADELAIAARCWQKKLETYHVQNFSILDRPRFLELALTSSELSARRGLMCVCGNLPAFKLNAGERSRVVPRYLERRLRCRSAPDKNNSEKAMPLSVDMRSVFFLFDRRRFVQHQLSEVALDTSVKLTVRILWGAMLAWVTQVRPG